MYYSLPITLPANTPKSAPVETPLHLVPGILHGISVHFPGGCVGLVRLTLSYHGHQVAPLNPDGHLAGDGADAQWDEYFPLDEEPYDLDIRGWNLDDTYAHTVIVRAAVLPADVYWRSGPSDRLQREIMAAFGLPG